MARHRSGTLERCKDRDGKTYYRAKIRLGDGSRERLRVPDAYAYSEERAREWAAAIQEREDAQGLLLAKRKAARGEPAPSETFSAWAKRWVVAREARGLTSAHDDRGRLATHVEPLIGGKPVTGITRADVEGVVEALDRKVQNEEMSWKTAWNVWAMLSKAFRDAMTAKQRDLRVREDNPCTNVAPPDRGAKKAKQFLYPSEFLALMRCDAVPLEWRRVIALAVYLFPRAGELEALEWDDVDLERGQVHVHRSIDHERDAAKSTKTGLTRRFAFERALMPVLAAMRQEAGTRRTVVVMPRMRDLAEGLRSYLRVAGVARAELFANDATRKWMTWHDLRATGITWMAVRGDEPLHIQHRAGHTSFSTTQLYIRQAEAVRDGFGDVFPDLAILTARPAPWSTNGPPARPFPGFRRGKLAERAGFEPAAEF